MRRLKTASQANFAQSVHAEIPRSKFLRKSSLKTTFNCGKLVPIYVDEVLPGDTRQITFRSLSRLSTPLFPTMDNIDLEYFAFFVPNRLVWTGWEELMGENKTGPWAQDPEPALVPVFNNHNPGDGTNPDVVKYHGIGDYMGLTPGMSLRDFNVSALPFRGYAMIYRDWFRDENLQAPTLINLGDTENGTSENYGPNSDLFTVNKYHDQFTSALPAPQKGDSPLIPVELNELIPVITGADHVANKSVNLRLRSTGLNDYSSAFHTVGFGGFPSGSQVGELQTKVAPEEGSIPREGLTPVNLWADPRGMRINSTTISELRTRFQILKLLEKSARSGSRYIETLKSFFGVDAGDYRLQRPEFLGHYKTMVGIHVVPQTSSTDVTSPQGNLAAYSSTYGSSLIVNKTFVEHGYLFIFAVARQVKTYQQGLQKHWLRRERFDFYVPTLSHISEQPIYNKELYCLGTKEDGEEVFGYQEAWFEYRYRENLVTAQMRTGAPNSFDAWHYADIYDSTPRLSSDWILDNSAVNVARTLASRVDEQGEAIVEDQIKMDLSFIDVATRAMPVFSIPGLVDHF